MKKTTHSPVNDLESLATDARALLAATAHVAEENVVEARKRITAALDQGQELFENLKERATDTVQAADRTVRDHPYGAMGVAFGVGAIIGCILARRH